MLFKDKEEVNEIALHRIRPLEIVLRQLNNPLLLILLVATLISYFLGQGSNAMVILWMMALSVVLGFWNEWQSEKTVSDLLHQVSLSAVILRDGVKDEVPARSLKVGQELYLGPGTVVPADVKILTCNGLDIDESVLTGESRSVTKLVGNEAYLGTVVKSGYGTAVVIAIGRHTQFGKLSLDIGGAKPVTEFQHGLASFGLMLTRVITIMSVCLFILNFLLGRPIVDSLLFSLAIAIGLTPELLPVVVTVSLAHGARRLAKKDVIVKRLVAIEDLGNMQILCTDKTGTLTDGKLSLIDTISATGDSDLDILHLGLICNSAVIHRGLWGDAIDTAIWEYAKRHNHLPRVVTKLFENPFDFGERVMFVVVKKQQGQQLIVKGAPESVLARCDLAPAAHKSALALYDRLSRDGLRVVALATKPLSGKTSKYDLNLCQQLTFAGYLSFSDTPKTSAKAAIDRLEELGVTVKVVTGDNEMVTENVCRQVGIPDSPVLLGSQVEAMDDLALTKHALITPVFARMSPLQKERVIRVLKSSGKSVAYMGDGVNDGPALRLADVGISVNSAVDIAKDVASIVLLKKSLSVIADGVEEGRRIFQNTLKYILMGTSSNFGNMLSAAGASVVLPFLPMTPTQILLANSMYDISQLTVPTDTVDPEMVKAPHTWDLPLIKRYMLTFGVISSLYDFLTFAVMWFGFGARGSLFQTGWFVESLATQIAVVFIIRTSRRFYRSRPSSPLLILCLAIIALAAILPFTPIAHLFNLVPLPLPYFSILVVMVITYLLLVETIKGKVMKVTV